MFLLKAFYCNFPPQKGQVIKSFNATRKSNIILEIFILFHLHKILKDDPILFIKNTLHLQILSIYQIHDYLRCSKSQLRFWTLCYCWINSVVINYFSILSLFHFQVFYIEVKHILKNTLI